MHYYLILCQKMKVVYYSLINLKQNRTTNFQIENFKARKTISLSPQIGYIGQWVGLPHTENKGDFFFFYNISKAHQYNNMYKTNTGLYNYVLLRNILKYDRLLLCIIQLFFKIYLFTSIYISIKFQ